MPTPNIPLNLKDEMASYYCAARLLRVADSLFRMNQLKAVTPSIPADPDLLEFIDEGMQLLQEMRKHALYEVTRSKG